MGEIRNRSGHTGLLHALGSLGLRPSEWLLSLFFAYVFIRSVWRGQGMLVSAAFAVLVPIALVGLARGDKANSRVAQGARDWFPAALLLVAYWSADWSARPQTDRLLENALIGWDRTILDSWGLHAAVEHYGVLLPAVLEFVYLLIYLLVPFLIAFFYVTRRRERLENFLFPFLLGTFVVYGLLPLFPCEAPRFAFPGEDLPQAHTGVHRFNVWVLDHLDIHSSVFPSGHVAVAVSAALAMRLAIPERRILPWTLFAVAVAVWIATVYARYHYAADGLVAMVVSTMSIAVMQASRARLRLRAQR